MTTDEVRRWADAVRALLDCDPGGLVAEWDADAARGGGGWAECTGLGVNGGDPAGVVAEELRYALRAEVERGWAARGRRVVWAPLPADVALRLDAPGSDAVALRIGLGLAPADDDDVWAEAFERAGARAAAIAERALLRAEPAGVN
jgi:hypothetical protein